MLTSLPHNTKVLTASGAAAGFRFRRQGQGGWVAEQYLTGAPVAPAILVPAQNQGYAAVQRPNAGSCPSRQYCTRIGSCEEARWYLANCSWGGALDGDGMACRARRLAGSSIVQGPS